jgi:hypothetical protein
MMRRIIGSKMALIVGLASGSVACSSSAPRETIDIDESSVVATGLRILHPAAGADLRQALREGRASEENSGFISGLEAGITYLSSDANQTLEAGQNLELDNETFMGPGEVDYDFDVLAITAAWRMGKAFPTGITIEGLLGLSYHGIDLDAEFMGVKDSESTYSFGPLIGAEVGWHSPIRVLLYGRFTGSIELSDEYDEPQAVVLEAGAVYHLGKHVDLGAGWRQWRYDGDSSYGFESDIDMEVSGPFFFLGFVF